MIVVSICTIPGRLNSLIEVFKSIEIQSLKPDNIILTISDYYPRMNKYYPFLDIQKLQEFLKDYTIPVELVIKNLDIGPVFKLLTPILQQSVSMDDIIITVDDDVPLYEKTIEMLYNSYIKNPNAIYGVMGYREGNFIHSEFIMPQNEYYVVDVIGGYRGVLYPRNLISDKFKDWITPIISEHRENNIVAMHDDHIFSYYFKSENIERRVCKFIPDGNEGIRYTQIPNNDGIMDDKDKDLSINIIESVIINNGLDWVIKNPY
jgi:hypothetical protein